MNALRIERSMALFLLAIDTIISYLSSPKLVRNVQQQLSIHADGHIELRNLISLWEVRVKVVLAIKLAHRLDLAAESKAQSDSKADGLYSTRSAAFKISNRCLRSFAYTLVSLSLSIYIYITNAPPSRTSSESTGSVPGYPIQMWQICVLGSAP